MKLATIECIFKSLNDAGVVYLVAGGLAVNAHGYVRYTKDLDVVLQLSSENIKKAFSTLAAIGYKPNVPVTEKQFADPEQRQAWIRDKGMQVLQLWSDEHRETPIDIFVTEPFPFNDEYQNAFIKSLYGSIEVRFVTIETLIKMKQQANREQDRIDIEHLRLIMEQNNED